MKVEQTEESVARGFVGAAGDESVWVVHIGSLRVSMP
jgi:hypothetical protein